MVPVVIGISGVSCGGKSLMCEKVAKKFPSVTVLEMDDYYRLPDHNMELDYPVEYNFTYANFEVVSAINFEQLLQDLEKKIQESSASDRHSVILVEGILIFGFRPIQKYFRKRYFITLPKDVAKERRRHRTYTPPDPETYFENYVWPYYIKHKESLADQKDIEYLDGSMEVDINLEKICRDLDNLIA